MGLSGGAGRGSDPLDVDREEDGTAGEVKPAETGTTEIDAATRRRVSVEMFARNEASLRRTALRYSLCADDADEALQRGLEILLTKAPSDDHRELVRWTQTVVKHEALSVRAERERTLAGPAAAAPEPGREDWVSLLPAELAGPAERAERHEAIERSREALTTLKPQELRALGLLAEGYSYAEIAEITGFSATKVNRSIAEGRERFRRFLVRREGGARCGELSPLLSAFADGEAEAADVATLREHLRTCAHCRATLRTYRAAPGAAAALLPVLPHARGAIVGRLHDAYAALATRVGGGPGASDSTLGGFAAAGGTRGAGMAALAKVLAICAGTVGGAAACVATGVVPAPLLDPPEHHRPAAKVVHHRRHLAQDAETTPVIEYETAPATETEAATEAQQQETSATSHEKKTKADEAPPAEETAEAPPSSENGAVEYVEPPPPPVETTSAASTSSGGGSTGSSSSGTAAGEFGP